MNRTGITGISGMGEAPAGRPAPAAAPVLVPGPEAGPASRGGGILPFRHLAATLTLPPLAAERGIPVLDAAGALSATAGAAVVLLTDWTPALAEDLSRHALRHPVVHVPVRFDGALALVGPVLRPAAIGCLSCAERLRLATVGGRTPWQNRRLALAGLPSPALLEAIGVLAADAIAAAIGGGGDPDGSGGSGDDGEGGDGEGGDGATVWAVHGAQAVWSTHRVRPFGGCPVCRPLPPDTAASAGMPAVPRPLPDPFELRQPNPATTSAALREALHDDRFGPVHHLRRTEDSVFGLTTALVTDGRPLRDGGYGRGPDFDSSERVALFEGIERLTSMRPVGRRTVLRSSFAALGRDRALDPQRLGLPDPAYHGHPASPTVPYSPDLELDWVHGWSLTHRRALAVPEHVAYWDPPLHQDGLAKPRVVYECSNGCGLGNSPQEAALYGLFEIAERDAFLMAWYARTPLRAIALPADDPQVVHLADRAALAGYRLTLLDATNDFRIPAVLAVFRHHGGHPAAPRAFVAAGAHHDPRAAIRSSVAEAVTNVFHYARRSAAEPGWRDPDRLRPMLDEPELVITLDDHVGLNTLPEAQPRLDFLLPDGPGVGAEPDWREIWPGAPGPVTDLTTLLDDTVRRLVAEQLEVVAVTLDEPGIRDRLGLHCAKVVVPGSLPMTFGHVNHRTRGLPRLLEVPYRLGRSDRPLRYDDLAIHPHPFP